MKIANFPIRKKFTRNKSCKGEVGTCFRLGPDLEAWELERFGRKEGKWGTPKVRS